LLNTLKSKTKNQTSVDISQPNALYQFSQAFYQYLIDSKQPHQPVILLCIGTDRATGDSLGPLIGYKLKSLHYADVFVYGTLDNPVHAKNLEQTIESIEQQHKDPFIIAMDACLGKMEHIGIVTVGEGSIKPGAGVNKDLSPVGHLFITGIVNFSGFMDILILQNTRLSVVMKMAELIAFGIRHALWKYQTQKGMPTIYGTKKESTL